LLKNEAVLISEGQKTLFLAELEELNQNQGRGGIDKNLREALMTDEEEQ
jgi:hypothetical protein